MTEKRFPPSAQRITKARREGRVIFSRWFSVGFSVLIVASVGQRTISLVRERTLIHYSNSVRGLAAEMLAGAVYTAFEGILYALAPVALLSVGVHLFQTRGAFSLVRLIRGVSSVGPISFAARVRESLRELPAALVRAALVLLLTVPITTRFLAAAVVLEGADRSYVYNAVVELVSSVVCRAAVALWLFGTAAYFISRKRMFKDLSMSIEELRQEVRDDQGDQHLKSMRKAEAQSLSMADLERRVRRSKVIIVQRKPV